MIREAVDLDVFELEQLAQVYADEDRSHLGLPYDRTSMMRTFVSVMLSDDDCLFVSIIKGKLSGFIWGRISKLPWSEHKLGMDNIFYVHPDCRGSEGVKLIRAYESWCIEKGASQIALSIASDINLTRSRLLCERLGYNVAGYQFRKEVKNNVK